MQYICFIWSSIILGMWSAIHTVSGKSISPFLFKIICAQGKAGKRGNGLIFVALVVEACRLFSSNAVKVNHKNDKS